MRYFFTKTLYQRYFINQQASIVKSFELFFKDLYYFNLFTIADFIKFLNKGWGLSGFDLNSG